MGEGRASLGVQELHQLPVQGLEVVADACRGGLPGRQQRLAPGSQGLHGHVGQFSLRSLTEWMVLTQASPEQLPIM